MSTNQNIAYQILELEVEAPLPEVALPEKYSGVAFVVRHKDKPIGFFMEALPGGTILASEDVAARVMKHVGTQILREKIYDELRGSLDHREFPALDIAICTHNRVDVLARCLENLRELGILDSHRSVRVLVIDNAPSDDQTARLVAAFPQVT